MKTPQLLCKGNRDKTQSERQQELGSFIREHRKRMDVSLRGLAGKLGVSASYLSDVELGRCTVSNTRLRQIADLLRGTETADDLSLFDTMLVLSGRMPVERAALSAIYEVLKKHEDSKFIGIEPLLAIVTLALWNNDPRQQEDFDRWLKRKG